MNSKTEKVGLGANLFCICQPRDALHRSLLFDGTIKPSQTPDKQKGPQLRTFSIFKLIRF
ncbi:conserved hypothetical protein [Vibrio parahaemolyticus Peru-466]|nr:conserved hypothetical protein [Vibrio parahaemolyticus Peru-466]EQM42491.1 hypothetical protein D025_4833 [Vibrio parahaemolyticus 949]EVU11213.1 hypothetical protein D046_7552 [Vibrio parahaemolyticus V-223/04]